MLEQLAVTSLRAASTGLRPRVITHDEIATLRGQTSGVEERWAYYLQLSKA